LLTAPQIMGTPFATTIDGYEHQWQVNYLAPFILTYNLLPLMLQTASKSADKTRVRVINLATEMTAILGPKSISLTDVNMPDACGPTAPLYVQRPGYTDSISLTTRNQPALLALEARFNPACQRAERPLQRTR
jgi:NAD(P)-dependent dehydrogenase (short-subunit alcohol dehydrogenase family)